MKSKSAARFLTVEALSPVTETGSPAFSETGGFSASLHHQRSSLKLRSPSPETTLLRQRREDERHLEDCGKDVCKASEALHPSTALPAPRSLTQTADVYEALGYEYMSAGSYQQAVNSFHRAVSLETAPGQQPFRLYYNLCEAYFRLEKYKQAIRFGTQANIYADQLPRSPELSNRLPMLFDFLMRAEEALKRFDKAKYWLKRALAQRHPKTGSVPPRGVIFPYCKPNQSIRASVDLTLKPADLTADATYSQLTRLKRGSGDWKKLTIKGDLRPGDIAFGPNTTRARNYIPLPDPQALALPLLYECWKRLKLGIFAHIRISEGAGDVWLLIVTCNGIDIREQLSFKHPWRRLQPSLLAAQLQLTANREMFLETTKSARIFPIELDRENREFEGVYYELIFKTDEQLREVEVTAEGAGCIITKIVVNDIHLITQKECKSYIRNYLLPSLRVSNNCILIEVEKSPSIAATAGGNNQSQKPLSTCHIGRKPLSWQSIPTAIETATTRRRYPSSNKEEVYKVQQGDSQREGIVIRFAEAESGTPVYQRDYRHLRATSQDCSPVDRLKSVVFIQANVRRFLVQRLFKLRKSQKCRKGNRQRLGMVLQNQWVIVTAYSASRAKLRLHLVDVVSKRATNVELEAKPQPLESKEACAVFLSLHEKEVLRTMSDVKSSLPEVPQFQA